MKLKPTALGIALGILCALYMVLLTYYPAISELVFGDKKGLGWIKLMEDIYPQYNSLTWYAPLVGAAMGFLDGFIGGLLFGLLYNNFSRFFKCKDQGECCGDCGCNSDCKGGACSIKEAKKMPVKSAAKPSAKKSVKPKK